MKLKNNLKWLLSVSIIHFLIACGSVDEDDGHGHKKGSIVSVDGSGFANVCEESQSAKIGDKLKVYENVCSGSGKTLLKGRSKNNCTKLLKGQAEVVEILDQHYSKIKAIGSLNLKVGEITQINW